MKSWFAIMIKEATRIAEILTPADFIGHHGKPPYIKPGKPLDPKESNGMRGSGPGGLDWRGHGRPPWDSKDLTADQNRRLSEFYRWGGVHPPGPTAGQKKTLP